MVRHNYEPVKKAEMVRHSYEPIKKADMMRHNYEPMEIIWKATGNSKKYVPRPFERADLRRTITLYYHYTTTYSTLRLGLG